MNMGSFRGLRKYSHFDKGETTKAQKQKFGMLNRKKANKEAQKSFKTQVWSD